MSDEKKSWVLPIALSCLVAVGVGVLIYFQSKKIDEQRAQADALRQKIEEDRALIAKTPDLVRKVIIQRETDEVIKEILSDDKDINNLVRTLHHFGQESQVAITSLKEQRTHGNSKRQDFERVGYTLALEGDAFNFLSFLDHVESHQRFMSVTSFKLNAASRNEYDRSEEGPRHRVQLDLETYVYRPTGAAEEVKIDHYERKRDLLISEISKRAAELRIPRYDYRGPQGRRDPWIDPRLPVDDPDFPVLSIEEQIAIVDELIEHADEAEELWEAVAEAENLIAEMKARASFEEKLAFLGQEILRVRDQKLLLFIPAERRFEKQVVEVVDSLHELASGVERGQGPSLAVLRETAEGMERHIQAQEYELALEIFDQIEPKLALAEREELKRPVVQGLRELQSLALTVLEFESIELRISGIAIYEDRRPVALINGQPVSEGELVGEELVVRNIKTDQIEFAFRGLVLARVLEDASAR